MTGISTARIPARHAAVVGVVSAVLILTGCSLPVSRPSAADPATALVTVDTHAHRSASQSTSQLAGVLKGEVLNGRACFWIEHSGVPPVMLVWPSGYRAKTDPLRLLDAGGKVIASVGAKLLSTGEPNAIAVTQSCAGTIMSTYLVDRIGGTLAKPADPAPVYGNAGYRTRAHALHALRAIKGVARHAHALGTFRTGERSVTIRLPRGSHVSGQRHKLGHFTIRWERSRFRSAALTATMTTVRRIARTGLAADALYAVDYDAARDRVVVAGELSADTAKLLRAVPGVLVAGSAVTTVGDYSTG